VTATAGPPKSPRSRRSRLARLVHRRRFYLQLARIAADRVRARDGGRRVFVSLMGGVGDLVNAFPSIDRLAVDHVVDMGTGDRPYRTLVEADPHVTRVWAPFVYKPARAAHRRLIERVLGRFYARVILLDGGDDRWWTRGRHLAETYALACGVPAPVRGAVHLPDAHRAAAAAYCDRHGLRDFVYVAQVIRRARAFRSWPLAHYTALYARLGRELPWPVVVDTTGSDETAVPETCRRLDRLDILTAAAVIARARLFVGPDSGLTHVAAALGVPTVAIHVGFPAESCRALGEHVAVVRQRHPFDDPLLTAPADVWDAVESLQVTA
jgi:hypothetical protein